MRCLDKHFETINKLKVDEKLILNAIFLMNKFIEFNIEKGVDFLKVLQYLKVGGKIMELIKRNKGVLSLISIIIVTAMLAVVTPESWTITKPIGYILLTLAYMIIAGAILLYFIVRR
jgi:uncharacterized membrane protein YcgQ (UPF0703/DUF1980 family)